jgi:alpha-amylase
MKYKNILILLLFIVSINSCKESKKVVAISVEKTTEPINWNNEVIYHVMQRSFYDSDGDLHGDLNGFVEKLDYLKELGATTILFTPLYESDFYHNYFPIDYENIDPEYGTKEEYIRFVKAVHKKGMKFLMDMETQYAQSGNIWFNDSYKNPKSKYSDFVYYSDSLNQYPEQIFMKPNSPLKSFNLWPDKKRNIVLLDLNHQKVKDYMMDFYTYWVDPNNDGNFDDGVDGFRIDHIMDDLDYKGLFVNMYKDFWNPIFTECKAINPKIFVLGEQSNWNHYGEKMVKESNADAAFSFPLRFALAGEEGVNDMYSDPNALGVTMKPKRIHNEVKEAMNRFSDTIFTVNFLENHDTDRWASVVNNNEGQKYIGAILNILLPGVPSIYYGQELGLTGTKKEYGSDANHIPVREAFPWTSNFNDKGNAVWYKNTGEWWDNSIWNSDVIKTLSLTSQKANENSIWSHYKKLIEIRTKNEAFRLGNYEPLFTDIDGVLAFNRAFDNQSFIVVLNVSENQVTIDNFHYGEANYENQSLKNNNSLTLKPYGFIIVKK